MGLSVIIPVYNGEKYIEECLRSIMNQTYKDLQIIVINDGSTDSTENIINKLIKEDNRIYLNSKENSGVSSARNYGLDLVNKDYITFVDCDDTLDLDMYEILMDYTKLDDYDIIHCGYKKIIDSYCVKEVNGTGRVYMQNSKEALKCIIGGKLFVGSLWNKIYKKKLFDDVRFDESLKINEDILINYQVFKKSKKTIFIDMPKYNYWKREISVCRSIDDMKKYKDSLKVSMKIYSDCRYSELEKCAEDRYIKSLLNIYRYSYFSEDVQLANYNQKMRKQILYYLKHNKIKGKKSRLIGVLICYTPKLYKYTYRIYDKYRIPNWDL